MDSGQTVRPGPVSLPGLVSGLRPLGRNPALLITAGLCFASGWLAYALLGSAMAPVIFWPPAGLALGAALLWGLRTLPAAFLGTALAVAIQGAAWPVPLALGLAAVVQGGVGALVLRWRGHSGQLGQVTDLIRLVIIGGLVAGTLALPLSYFAMHAVDGFWEATLGQRLVATFMAHLDAVLVFTPALICWVAVPCPRQKSRWLEIGLVLGGLVLVSLLLAHPHLFGQPARPFRPYPLLPFLLWLALRSDPRITVLGLAWVYAVAASASDLVDGGLYIWMPGVSMLPIHGFIAVLTLSFMALAIMTAVRNQVEQTLRESEARFRNVVNLTRNCLWEVDNQGRFTYVDPHAEAVLGARAEALLGRLPEEVWPSGMGDSWRGVLRHALFTNEAQTIAHTRQDAGGAPAHLETSCVLRLDELGRHQGWQGITRDISDRVRMARDLDESNMRFRQLAENIDQVFWVSDREMRHVYYLSPHCDEVLGVCEERLLQDPLVWREWIHEEDLPMARQALEAVSQGEAVARECRIVHPRKGLRWLRAHSIPFMEAGEVAMNAGIVEDITEQKLAEQAHMAEALAHRDTLIREVHHRIKNNLQTVVGLLRREAGKHPEARESIEAAISQVQTVAVVHGLHGRLSQHSIMLCELLPAIVYAVSELTGIPIIREGISEGCGELRIRDSETVAVALILNELVSNAVKHWSPGDGKPAPVVKMDRQGLSGHITISNPGKLPPIFDFASGLGLGTGLGLVRALMPSKGMTLRFRQEATLVVVEVVVETPVLVDLQAGK